MSRYTDLCDAVGRYYGSGSDQWRYIVENIGTNDLGEAAKILKSAPGVDVWVNGDNTVVNYAVRDVLKEFSDSENIGSINNSNTISSITNASVNASVPSIISKSATTGELSGISGIGLRASTGTTVTGIARTIGVGVGAVALGAQLGKIIGTALYEGNPNTWDEGIISGLSHEDWSKFAISIKDQATEGILGLFGVNGNDTTMYLDENFAAYMAWYMSQNGMLEQTLTPNTPPENSSGTITLNAYTLDEYQSMGGELSSVATTFKSRFSYSGKVVFDISGSPPTNSYSMYKPPTNSNINYYGLSNGLARSDTITYGERVKDDYNIDSVIVSYNTNTGVATIGGGGGRFSSEYIVFPQYLDDIGSSSRTLAITGVSKVGYKGIDDNPNSTQFNPTGVGSVSTALGALKNQYPELWDNAVKTKVPQEDGSEDERTYIPLPIPNFKDAYDKQPTTGTPSQSNPSIKPDTTPDDELDNTANTIAPPQTPSQDDNTGSGDTPSIITPTQQASSLWAIYNPTLAELNSLGAWLWSSNFIDQLLKIFNDPMQAIIGLHKVYATPQISGTGNIKVGYLDSGVSSNIVGNQYTYIDCGTVSLREYYGNVLDYSPYTDVKLYLPFIGIVPLDIADVSRASINVKYGVDVLTGACLASVSVYRDNAGGVLYQYSGNCACQYPLSSGSYMGMVTGAIGALGSLARGSVVGAMMGVAGMHTNIEHSGGFSGNAGAMGIKKPYLIISRPQSQMNDAFPSIQGYPSNYYTILNKCNGFTQVKDCHVENINATDYELQQIKKLLLEGVII